LYIVDGVPYKIDRSFHSAQVLPGSAILDGSFGEALFFCGLRLKEAVEPASVRQDDLGGRLRLTGTVRFLRTPKWLADGTRLELVFTKNRLYPVRGRFTQNGALRESFLAFAPLAGRCRVPGRLQVTRYSNHKPRFRWTVTARRVACGTAIRDAEFVPRDPSGLWVADMRLATGPTSYHLTPGQEFPSVRELQELAGSKARPRPPGRAMGLTALLRAVGVGIVLVVGAAWLRSGRKPRRMSA